MGWVNVTNVGSLTAATAAALLTAALSPLSYDGATPLISELICWALALAFFGLLRHLGLNYWKGHGNASVDAPKYTYWIIALSIAVTAVFSSFFDSTWVAPLVAFKLVARSRDSLFTRLQAWLPGKFRYASLVFCLGIMLFLSLVPSLDTMRLAFALLTSFGLIGTYASLIHLFNQRHGEILGQAQLETQHLAYSIAVRAVGLLAMVAAIIMPVLPGVTFNTTSALFAGGMRFAHWIIIFWLTQETRWEIAPTIWAYVSASENSFQSVPGSSLGLFQTFARITIAVLSICQIIDFIPKTEKRRILLVAFAIWPVMSLLPHTSLNGHIPSLPGAAWPGTSSLSPHHPVEVLIRKAQLDFERLIKRQSKTLSSAETEYRRRYSRDPPPGFDKWFAYAQSKNSILIDDFDMINEDLRPFWKITPQRLRESIDHVSSLESLALRKCGINNGKYHGQGSGWIVDDLGKLLAEVSKDIPDVDFAFDVVDEPRVIITQKMLDIGGVSKPQFTDAGHLSIWDRTTSACAHATAKESFPKIHDHGLALVQDWYHAKDVCSHPEFGLMHGFFASPMTCLLTDAPIPVLSQAAPTSFGDIVYPSPWYAARMDQGDYKEGDDPLWEKKAKNLYWAGSTTGSYSWNGTWKYSHRQRFVKLVETLDHTEHTYLKESKPGKWVNYRAIEDHRNLFDVKLTAIIQCEDRDCEEQKRFFQLGEKEEGRKQFGSQFVFDTDGNSFSGRFYTLLRSRSAVLKQTVLREWHDERLIPWVHFIPVSLSIDELPELMRYLTSHEDGKKRAKEIADAGREWHGKVLRKEDFTIYLYRLMLELVRIMDPAREVES